MIEFNGREYPSPEILRAYLEVLIPPVPISRYRYAVGPPHRIFKQHLAKCKWCRDWCRRHGWVDADGEPNYEETSVQERFRRKEYHEAARIVAIATMMGVDLQDPNSSMADEASRLSHVGIHEKRFRRNKFHALMRKEEFRIIVEEFTVALIEKLGLDAKEEALLVYNRLKRLGAPADGEKELMKTDKGKIQALQHLALAVGHDITLPENLPVAKIPTGGQGRNSLYIGEAEVFEPPALPGKTE